MDDAREVGLRTRSAARVNAHLRVLAVSAALALLGFVGLLLAGAPQGSALQPAVEADSLSRAFRAAAKRVLPAVVVVKTTSDPTANVPRDADERFPQMRHQVLDDDEGWHEFFFEDEAVPPPSLASGVIIDPQGIVLTNLHVVEGAEQVTVMLPDGPEFAVRRIIPLPGLDLAVLQLETSQRLPAATLGDSDTLEIGDWVLAMGCPLELEQTVSAGIISAKGRSLPDAGRTRLLQTDAAISPGSSGGPLVNMRGEVVGIATAIASEDGGYQGIGFAIPINLAKERFRRVHVGRQP